jgi:YVTN family beta-propeller protein
MRYAIVLLVCFAIGCNDNSVLPPGTTDVSAGDVLVINEGGFQRGNASIGKHNLSTNVYNDKVFQDINGAIVGDVLQSVTAYNGEYWVTVNNSGKVLVLDSVDLSVKFEITGFTSPRYLTISTDGRKAFVSDLYADEIAVVSTSTYQITKFIPLEGWTDQMALVGDYLYVANRDRPYVFVIDQKTEVVVDSVDVAYNPNSLLALGSSYVAVLSEGRLGSNDVPKFQLILTDSSRVIRELPFKLGEKPSLLRINPKNGNIYYAFKGIHYIHPVDFTDEGLIIDLPDANIYGFDIDPITGNFYVSDALDYVEKSEVRVYKNGKTLVNQFTAGVISNGFVFR